VISEERIRDEFLKGLKSAQHQQNFLYNLNDLGLMEQVFPDLDLFLFINPLIDNSLVIIAQILRGNASKVVYERLMALKYTAHEAQTVEFLLKLKDYQRPEDVVRFKKDRKRCLFDNKDLLKVAKLFTEHFSMIKKMLEFPYPTVKGEEFMDKFQGKELGEQINMREIENFKAYSAGGSPSISCD
jgi:tRNA nucleotidyltransferase/poly(A) polymerase